jgi:hypothetical protein
MTDRSSVIPPLFVNSAKDLLSRLTEATGPAWDMRKEAEEILELFKLWEYRPATATERADTVSRLLDLHRRAMEFLVKNRTR